MAQPTSMPKQYLTRATEMQPWIKVVHGRQRAPAAPAKKKERRGGRDSSHRWANSINDHLARVMGGMMSRALACWKQVCLERKAGVMGDGFWYDGVWISWTVQEVGGCEAHRPTSKLLAIAVRRLVAK